LAEAARRAAENGRVDVLKLLLERGTPVNAIAGSTTLLCAAAQNGRRKAVELLLQSGADANLADAEGTPPLIHAVLAESAPVVKLLMQAGADATRTDAQGRSAADYSRSEQMDSLLTATPLPQ
jgi:ankyrin repeat protein